MIGSLTIVLWASIVVVAAMAFGVTGNWLVLPVVAGGSVGYRMAARRRARLLARKAQGKLNCPFLASTWWP